MKVKQIQRDGIIIHESFYDDKYPSNFTLLANFVNSWCCIFFGLGNYYGKHDMRFLILTFICLTAIVLLLYPDKADKHLPIDLKSKNGWLAFAIILVGICIISSFAFYTLLAMQMPSIY